MKLISCYITGFGALRDQAIAFEEDLTVFFQRNGAGKSTLADFLKAMLYGMPSYKKNSKGFEDRLHYYPFGGGAYGGSLTLEFEGEAYCITRRFDEKSETKDTLTVTCQGLPTLRLGKEPGRTIFQVDKDSFERTAFFTADPGELGATTGIAGRLQSFLDNTEGPGDFDAAREALDAAARQLQSTRGQNGRIARQQEAVRQLQQDIASRNQLSDALEQKYAARQTLSEGIGENQALLRQNQATAVALERWQQYQRLQREACRKAESCCAVQALCGEKQPDDTQRKALADHRAAIADSQAALRFLQFPQEKQRQLSQLQSLYPKGLPDPGALDQAEKLQNASDEPAIPPEKPGNLGKILMIFGIVLALGGVAAAFFQWIVGLCLVAVGLGCAVLGFLRSRNASAVYRSALARQAQQRQHTQSLLAALLAPYALEGYRPQLRTHSIQLESLLQEQAQLAQQRAQLQSELDQAVAHAGAIFSECGLTLSQDPVQDIDRLLKNLDALAPLARDAQKAAAEAESYRQAHRLTGQMPQLTADPELLSRQIELQRDRLARLEREILEDEHHLEDLAESPLLLERALEEEAALRQRYRLLTAARDCLVEAEAALKAQHIDPVRSRFDVYADALADALGAQVELDKNFGLFLLEKGGQYSDRHLSAGQRAVVALCLRLALLDNLYPGDKPPIILDDPFVFLDGAHLEKAKALVKSLSRQWQILYFTCHESRTM